MTCKYLKYELLKMPPEVGGSIHPESIDIPPYCSLGRLNRLDAAIDKTARCEKVEDNGPCWWWSQEHPGKPEESSTLGFKTP
jgi:hypothetical protein